MTDFIYKPLTKKQKALVEELTARLDRGIYIEKRDSDDEFLPGVLIPRSLDKDPFPVMVSPVKYELGDRVLLCTETFPEMDWVELIFELETGDQTKVAGEISASRPGRRTEDKVRAPPIQIARFFQGGRR